MRWMSSEKGHVWLSVHICYVTAPEEPQQQSNNERLFYYHFNSLNFYLLKKPK